MKLGYAVLMVAVGAMLMFAPAAMGADKTGHGFFGVVTKLDPTPPDKPTKITVKGKTDEKTFDIAADVKVVTGAKGEEKDATLADVKVDARVAVTSEDGKTATKIAIMPAGGHKGGHGAPPAEPAK